MFEPEKMVVEFNEKMESSTDPKLWEKLIQEEATEVVEAAANLLKELSDLAYVTFGMGWALKRSIAEKDAHMTPTPDMIKAINIMDRLGDLFDNDVITEAFKRVHESNMSKLGNDGKPIRREDGKVLKGPNYKPPVLTDLV